MTSALYRLKSVSIEFNELPNDINVLNISTFISFGNAENSILTLLSLDKAEVKRSVPPLIIGAIK